MPRDIDTIERELEAAQRAVAILAAEYEAALAVLRARRDAAFAAKGKQGEAA